MIKKGEKVVLLLLTVTFSVLIVFFLITRHNSSDRLSLTESTNASTPFCSVDGKVNINTATAEMLTQIPGIGDVLSKRIVQYRQENGPYHDLRELTNIKGIGEVTLEKIQEYLTTGDLQ